jgi:hypothetical protein
MLQSVEARGGAGLPVVFSSATAVREAAAEALGGRAPVVQQALDVREGPKYIVSFRRHRISYSEVAAHCGVDVSDGEAGLWISQTLNRALAGSNAHYYGPYRPDYAWTLLAEFRFLADPDNKTLITPSADIHAPRTRRGTKVEGEAKAQLQAWELKRKERNRR